MRITAITKYKHGDLLNVLRKLNWNQAELARRAGVTPGAIGRVINLQCRPSQDLANKIQVAIGEAGVFIDVLEMWPESFRGLAPGFTSEQTADFDLSQLGWSDGLPVAGLSADYDLDKLPQALSTLDERERRVIESRYMDNQTFDQVANKYGVTRERIRQIESKALRLLRKPSRLKLIEAS